MRPFLLSLVMLSFLSSCKEFYDEDYRNSDLRNESISNEDLRDTSYVVDLKTTDFNVPNLKGSARIVVQNDEVKVNLSVSGIPANLIQLHYTYLTVPCNALSFVLPSNSPTIRSYQINETTSIYALAEDLRSSGASSGADDINLLRKSLVVKAFSNFSGIPNSDGTNQLTILCGEIKLEENTSSSDDLNEVPVEEF
jgi:hypothetical protein